MQRKDITGRIIALQVISAGLCSSVVFSYTYIRTTWGGAGMCWKCISSGSSSRESDSAGEKQGVETFWASTPVALMCL